MRESTGIGGDRASVPVAFHACPGCAGPAEVVRRWVFDSTDGPVEHVKVRCVVGHWFAMPAWMLAGDP